MPDEEVAAELVAVKGLGQWTADMFLMFHLGRPDVLPVGDLGIRRAVERAYGLPGLPNPAELTRDRRAVAPAPDAGVPVPVALPRQRAGLISPRLAASSAARLREQATRPASLPAAAISARSIRPR